MPRTEIKARRYHVRDQEAVMRITEESFGGFCLESRMEEHFGPIAGRTWQQRKCEGIRWELQQRPEHVFVAECGGSVVGYVCTRVYRDASTGHIANMAVARDFQGRGVGKALMDAALKHLRKCGMRYARIETLEGNYKGEKFYPACGFKEIGRQIFYFREL